MPLTFPERGASLLDANSSGSKLLREAGLVFFSQKTMRMMNDILHLILRWGHRPVSALTVNSTLPEIATDTLGQLDRSIPDRSGCGSRAEEPPNRRRG